MGGVFSKIYSIRDKGNIDKFDYIKIEKFWEFPLWPSSNEPD